MFNQILDWKFFSALASYRNRDMAYARRQLQYLGAYAKPEDWAQIAETVENLPPQSGFDVRFARVLGEFLPTPTVAFVLSSADRGMFRKAA